MFFIQKNVLLDPPYDDIPDDPSSVSEVRKTNLICLVIKNYVII